jgi:hypothetical protein
MVRIWEVGVEGERSRVMTCEMSRAGFSILSGLLGGWVGWF